MTKGLPLVQKHDHAIDFQPRSVLRNIMPYIYPHAQKNDIDCMVQETLEADIIQPS